jgi:ribonuclease HI
MFKSSIQKINEIKKIKTKSYKRHDQKYLTAANSNAARDFSTLKSKTVAIIAPKVERESTTPLNNVIQQLVRRRRTISCANYC